MESCKLMPSIFYRGMFNRKGRRMKVILDRTVSNGTETYSVWRAAGKPDREYPRAENDKYLLHVEVNGYLVPLGLTDYTLTYECGSKPVEEKLYDGQKERGRHYDELRKSGGEQAVSDALEQERLEIVAYGGEFAHQADFIRDQLAEHIETYLTARENDGASFPDYIGALALDDVGRCMELSAVYQEKCRQEKAAYAARIAEEDRLFCEEQNRLAEQKVSDAIRVIRSGGSLKNEMVHFYRSRYHSTSCPIVSYLMRTYQVNVPLRTQGWINGNLQNVTICNGRCSSVGFLCTKKSWGRGSSKFFDCMREVIRAIMAEKTEVT